MNNQKISCPYCRSINILPFEEEDESPRDYTFIIIFTAAFLLISFYFLFVILSYMSYPIMVIILITLSSLYQNRKERRKNKPGKILEKDFLCLDCGQSFKQQVEEK
ncbi:MAG: hypothetical protein KAT17_07445 [Candidatus Aminicenantes bacterium]|nr:hypothetical protein [Candidatus Aminicenantes bacterium]